MYRCSAAALWSQAEVSVCPAAPRTRPEAKMHQIPTDTKEKGGPARLPGLLFSAPSQAAAAAAAAAAAPLIALSPRLSYAFVVPARNAWW